MNKTITVFHSDHCIHCTNLIKWLTERAILFKSININDPAATTEITELEIKAIPFTIIEDTETKIKEVILGFDLQKLQNVLE